MDITPIRGINVGDARPAGAMPAAVSPAATAAAAAAAAAAGSSNAEQGTTILYRKTRGSNLKLPTCPCVHVGGVDNEKTDRGLLVYPA